jgi:predicted ATPase
LSNYFFGRSEKNEKNLSAKQDQKKKNPWISALKVYFVERPPEGSTFKEVRINEYGAVMDWPEGFFDQSQQEAEAILRAAAKKRKTQREK